MILSFLVGYARVLIYFLKSYARLGCVVFVCRVWQLQANKILLEKKKVALKNMSRNQDEHPHALIKPEFIHNLYSCSSNAHFINPNNASVKCYNANPCHT